MAKPKDPDSEAEVLELGEASDLSVPTKEVGYKESSDLMKSAVGGAKWALLQNWGDRVLSLVTFVILGRILDPSYFGILALAAGILAVLTIFIDSGVSEAVVRSDSNHSGMLDTAFWMTIIAGVALSLICFGCAGLVASIYDEPDLANVLRALSLALAIKSVASVHCAIMSKQFMFRQLATRQFAGSIAGGIVGITWAIVSPSVWALAGQYLAAAIVSTVVVWLKSTYRPRIHFERSEAKELWGFASNVLGIRGFSIMTEQGDTFIVGFFLGSTQLGYYATGFRVYQIVNQLITSSLTSVALPAFSRLKHDMGRLNNALLQATRTSATLAIPLFVCLGALAEYLVPFIFGDKWRPSIPVMQALSALGVLTCVMFFDRSVLIAVGKVRLELAIVVTATIGNVLAFLIGAQWSITGVAIAFLVRAYLFWPIRLLSLRYATGLSISVYMKQWLKPAFAGLLMLVIMLSTQQLVPSSFEFVTSLVAGMATYLLATSFIAPESMKELRNLAAVALNKK